MNSVEWWNETKRDPAKLEHWLKRQYIGEITASDRIMSIVSEAPEKHRTVLKVIANQENQHAALVEVLLSNRGIELPVIEDAESRYWEKPLAAIGSFADAAAVASHAERMRLERIRAIVNDPDAPIDISLAFGIILNEEVWHEKAFAAMTDDQHMEAMKESHELGRKALGLEA